MKQPGGAVRLLTESDLVTSVVGWKPGTQGAGSLVNSKGWALLRVVVQKVIDGRLKDLYDQPLIVENAGSMVVCKAGDKVGLVQNYRFTAKRLLEAGADYVKRLNEEGRWDELLEKLGEWQWELPRGLSQVSTETNLEKFVLETAKAEALEESGFSVANARVVGMVNANTTFFAHSQYVVAADIVGRGESRPEALEILGKTRMFSARELRFLVDYHALQDGLTFASLALAGFHF
ncbi:hypothetical protein HYT45_03230 [Candidatus Uhrbacteria bacterium]|nr:hypothetical protein [Candidatus Uhrbacteria bacterium]